jgi:hypothetical protein
MTADLLYKNKNMRKVELQLGEALEVALQRM